jgi:hypothetical protein
MVRIGNKIFRSLGGKIEKQDTVRVVRKASFVLAQKKVDDDSGKPQDRYAICQINWFANARHKIANTRSSATS